MRRARPGGIGWKNPFTRSRESIPDSAPATDPFDRAVDDDALDRLLDRIQADALAVYAARGLPVEAGDYVRRDDESEWRRIDGRLTPEQRWSWVQNHPREDGWRFARLHDLGRHHDDHDLNAAALLLQDVDRMRSFSVGGTASERLGLAITLGAAWQALGSSTGEPIKLALPPRLTDRWMTD